MSKLTYETRTTKLLREFEKDLSNNRISREEFSILVGLLIEKEFSDNIKNQFKRVMPTPKRPNRGFGFLNYEWKYTHAE